MSAQKIHVLLVDDEVDLAFPVTRELSRSTEAVFEVAFATSMAEARQRFALKAADAILLDLNLPDSEGLETFHTARREFPDAAIVILSGMNEVALAVQAVRDGAADYLVKSVIDTGAIPASVVAAVERFRRERAAARSQAAQSALTKTLAGLSHYVSTPLNAIIGFSDLLEKEVCGPLNSKQHEAVHFIHESGEDLCELLMEVASLSRLESGRAELAPERIPLTPFFNAVRDRAAQAVRARGGALEASVPEDLPDLEADGPRMRQAFRLLEDVLVRAVEKDLVMRLQVRADESELAVELEALGPGRASAAGTRDLAILLVRRIVEVHGGSLETSIADAAIRLSIVIPLVWLDPARERSGVSSRSYSRAPSAV